MKISLAKYSLRIICLVISIFALGFPVAFGIVNVLQTPALSKPILLELLPVLGWRDSAYFTNAIALTWIPIIYGLTHFTTGRLFSSIFIATLIGYATFFLSWFLMKLPYLADAIVQNIALYNFGLVLPALANLKKTYNGVKTQNKSKSNFLFQVILTLLLLYFLCTVDLNNYHHGTEISNLVTLVSGLFASSLIWFLVKNHFIMHLEYFQRLILYIKVTTKPFIAFFVGYFVIVIFFAGIYSLVYSIKPDSFIISQEIYTSEFHKGDPYREMLFYSFSVITSLGFSSLTPKTALMLTLTSLESLLGLVWLTVILASTIAYLQRPFNQITKRFEKGISNKK